MQHCLSRRVLEIPMPARPMMCQVLLTCVLMSAGLSGTALASCGETSSPRFISHDNGTVSDSKSGLVWKQCAQGLSGAACTTGSASALTWVDALNEARGDEYAGFTNWRLPKIEELELLLTECADGVKIDPAVFPNSETGELWSSSANLDYATDAWAMDLEKGIRVIGDRADKKKVLLVRNTN